MPLVLRLARGGFKAGLILCGLMLGINASSYTPSAQTPFFRSGVELLTLDVTVVDRDGRPVSGLTASDFVVEIAGKHSPVRFVDFVEYGYGTGQSSKPVQAPALPSAESHSGGRVIVFVFDDLSAKPGDAKLLLAAAARSLKELDPSDLVGLTSTSGFGPVLTPTHDRSALASALAGC